jgi:hypothetical protein
MPPAPHPWDPPPHDVGVSRAALKSADLSLGDEVDVHLHPADAG